MEKKILVAVDTTPCHHHLVRYLCGLFAGETTLGIHLISIVPFHAGSASRELLHEQDLLATMSGATRKKYEAAGIALTKAADNLRRCGFPEERLSSQVHLARAGALTDIMHEAQRGRYDALLFGKRDLGLLEKAIAGSFTAEALTHNRGLPLWIVSGEVSSGKFLVPVDCSPHTLNAVDHLAFMLKNNPIAEITLFHSCSLLSSEHITPREQLYEKWGAEWVEEHLRGDAEGHYHFEGPEQILREAGFSMERVHRLQTRKGIEPGQMIVHHVKHDGFGTIVMGRRQQDVSKGIFKGVSDRVLAHVKNVAIWLVG